jgi:NAD(P)-dependent dehydrogenase (short-subunit alcohol dehydrogenase family)
LKGSLSKITSYVMAKHGVVGLTKSAALEYAATKLRINAVCPGTIETEPLLIMKKENPEMYNRVAAGNKVGRLGQTGEIAAAVTFLLSDAASFITGSIFAVDGGNAAS